MNFDHSKEIDRLLQVEYGDRTEFIVRILGIGLGGGLFYIYLGSVLGLIWPVIFYLMQAIYFTFLWRNRLHPMKGASQIANALFLFVMLSFLWVPGYLAAHPDKELSYIGILLICTLVVFLIRRGDTLLMTVIVEMAAIFLVFIYVLISKLQQEHNLVPNIALVIVTFAVSGYLVQAIAAGRRLRLDSEAAADKAMQEQKLAAIGQLAGGVAHDFNNVLTAISGNLELYDHIDDPTERDHVVHEARAAAGRAADVVRQLLIYARKAPTNQSPIEIVSCMNEMAKLARSLVTENVRMSLELPKRPLFTLADESQLLTAMLNIVVNAMDAMPTGGTFTIRVAPVETGAPSAMIDGTDLPPGAYLRLDFRDTGSGIPDTMLPQVIEPFFTTKAAGKGTGLGLSMVQGFARNSGGGLDITSGPTGTTISLYLPCIPAQDAA
ncbi:sensor histidine kinase [Primorskyibacter sp. 2E107]|uniref:sensor histidine kinase n=1 Tax=Primorskyibacter sp. 2E107 TaxID=3403458 RepID=UPI003AF59687